MKSMILEYVFIIGFVLVSGKLCKDFANGLCLSSKLWWLFPAMLSLLYFLKK